MERKSPPLPLKEKLIVAATVDFPQASEIICSFPEDWELVQSFKRDSTPLYVAGFPASKERARADQFYGLPREINLSMTTYRLYKLFEPWRQPVIPVAWDTLKEEGVVLPGSKLRVRLNSIAQAQMWKGSEYGVLWEAYMFRSLHEQRLEELITFWQAVEQDMGVRKIFTHPHEPTFQQGYTDFLSSLGYAPDPDYERWWSKER